MTVLLFADLTEAFGMKWGMKDILTWNCVYNLPESRKNDIELKINIPRMICRVGHIKMPETIPCGIAKSRSSNVEVKWLLPIIFCDYELKMTLPDNRSLVWKSISFCRTYDAFDRS
jgi:hypothetical protein